MNSSSQVYQYCKVDTECVKGADRYHKAQCDVMFNVSPPLVDVTTTFTECVTDLPTPTVREDKFRDIHGHMRG